LESVDVAIVGGGIAGASMAYFLAREGVRNVLVLERSAVASGASGRASGLVAFLTSGHPAQAALSKASADLYYNWTELVGGAPAISPVGGLALVPESDRTVLEHEVGLMREAGHDTRLLSRHELAELVPKWNLDGADLAAYSPGSGYIDPPMVTTALMNRARGMGVRVYQGAEVTSICIQGGRATGLEANRGAIAADAVVIATGAWSARMARMVGASLEVWPVRHQVMHLKPPPGVSWPFPGCGDPYNCVYFRPEPGGLVLAANAGPDDYPDEPPGDPEHFDPTTSDWYAHWITRRLARRFPAMSEAEIVGGHSGVYPKGPDNFPLLGQLGEIEGLYCICDTAGSGMTSSPGLARALAETLVRGSAFVDIHPFRPSRHAEGATITASFKHQTGIAGTDWSQ
jgi:glycine/D-amino acid oxidase-like deaminating enzyme